MLEKLKEFFSGVQLAGATANAIPARYKNLKASSFISDTVKIGQATSDERGKVTGGKAGDQSKSEVATGKWTYSSGDNYNSWKYVFRANDTAVRLRIAKAAIDACNNDHIGYDQNMPDRKTCFKEAKKVGFDLSKITTNCECTCSELANVCIAAAGLKSYLPVDKRAYVDSLRPKLLDSSEFVHYSNKTFTQKSDKLVPGDIVMSGCHTIVIVKTPERKATKSITTIAKEVINGDWSSGDARKVALEAFGYNYVAVQKKVEEILNPPAPTPTPAKKGYGGPWPTFKKVKRGYIKKGDKNSDVGKWQKFLDWYFNGKVGKADNVFGPNTHKWTVKFQEKEMGKGQGDGTVGPKTIAAAKKIKK